MWFGFAVGRERQGASRRSDSKPAASALPFTMRFKTRQTAARVIGQPARRERAIPMHWLLVRWLQQELLGRLRLELPSALFSAAARMPAGRPRGWVSVL